MTKIKICGITVLKDALAAIDAGADMLGFNFYAKSPRYLRPDACREITVVLRKDFPQITLVGVFVNAPVAEIRSILETAQLHLAQLHGDETPEMLAELGSLAFKAIRLPSSVSVRDSAIESVFDPSAFIRYSVKESVFNPALLVDAAVKGVYGGSGVVADWSTAAQLARMIPLLLAGGLTPENVAEALEQVQPWGVDVASGVEASPGVKDPAKMKKFVEQVHSKK